MHYFKCDIEALWSVLIEMPLDLGGFYMRTLLAMYRSMEGLPADDNAARMRMGGVDIRTYRRMKTALLGYPKCLVQKPSGRISNERFESEVVAYVTEFKNRQKAGVERETKRRVAGATLPTSAELPADIGRTSAGHPAKIQEVSGEPNQNQNWEVSKKLNENNDASTTILPKLSQKSASVGVPRARVLELELELERKERAINHPPRDDHAGDGIGPSEGPLHPKIAHAARMLAVMFGSETDPDNDRGLKVAEEWQVLGPDAVLEAAMDFQAKRDDRTEHRQLSNRLFGQYVRQADMNIKTRAAGVPAVDVVKPPPRKLVPGPIGDGFVLGEDGKLQAVNGHQAIWLERFGGDEKSLDLILTSIKGRLKINGTPLEAQIEGMLADKAVDLGQRAKNYAAQSEINRAPRALPGSASIEGKLETQADRLRRYAREGGL
jgi:uncharacterized protein YdaU (DUF1376 family)